MKPIWERRPLRFYVDPGVPDGDHDAVAAALPQPGDPDHLHRALGRLLRRLGLARARRRAGARRRGELQLPVGARPAADAARGRRLARCSCAASLPRGPPRSRSRCCRALGILGYLYFTVSYPTPDGDVLKATYMLTTTAGWALGFGYALDRLRGRWFALVVALLASARSSSCRSSSTDGTARRRPRACPRGTRRARGAAPSRARRRSALGSAAIASGSDGRMNAGSTTTAGSPESANAARHAERIVAVELPRELEAGERERAVGELPDVVQPARAEDVVAVEARLVGHAADRRPGGGSRSSRRRSPARSPSRAAPSGCRARAARSPCPARSACRWSTTLRVRNCGAAAVRLVVEEDPAGDPDVVRLAVAAAEQVRGGLRGGVRALRVERGRLVVDDALARHRAEHLARRGLVEARRRAVERGPRRAGATTTCAFDSQVARGSANDAPTLLSPARL